MTVFAPPELPDAGARAARLRGAVLAELCPPAHPPLRPALALVAVVVAALAIAFAAVSRDAAPALAVEREDGWLVLRIADVDAGAEALTRDLREAGVNGEVKLLPVPDDLVGAWAIVSERAGRDDGGPETVRLDRIRIERDTLRIPIAEVRESTGTFVFYAGRPAREGEKPLRDGRLRFRR